jgi:hypothetical protein
MWVTAFVDLGEYTYEVGAEVEPYDEGSYEVGEPTFSGPYGELATSRLALDPQAPGTFEPGWSDEVEEALVEAYQGRLEDARDLHDDWRGERY